MSGLFGLFDHRSQSLENPAVPLSSVAVAEWLFGPRRSSAGVDVTERTALNMAAVWRATTVNSAVSAALPILVYRRGTLDQQDSRLLNDPHPEMTAFEFWRLSYVHRLLWGNSYAQKVRNNAGQLVELWPITPDRVKVARVKPSAGNPGGKLFAIRNDEGHVEPFTTREILHIPGLGYDGVCGVSAVRAMATAIGLGIAAEEYGARLFGNGTLLSGILQTEQRLDSDQADALKKRWREKMAGLGHAHDVAVLDSGATFQPLSMPNTDAQFVESRKFQVSEVARFFGVPPYLLYEMEKTTSWGTGLEQQATGWVMFDLHPNWLAPTEQRVTKELLGPGLQARYNVRSLLRGDAAARAEFYTAMRTAGAFSANDIRDEEDRPPIEGGDTYLEPLNMAPAGSQGGTNAQP